MSRRALSIVLSSMLLWSCVSDSEDGGPARPVAEMTGNAQAAGEGAQAVTAVDAEAHVGSDAGIVATNEHDGSSLVPPDSNGADAMVLPDENDASVDPAPQDGGVAVDASSSDDATTAASSGLPCDVQALFQERCVGCHSAGARSGVTLLTRDQVMGDSLVAPGTMIAERALLRMRDDAKPMPPRGDRVTEDAMAPLEAWIANGMPETVCAP